MIPCHKCGKYRTNEKQQSMMFIVNDHSPDHGKIICPMCMLTNLATGQPLGLISDWGVYDEQQKER